MTRRSDSPATVHDLAIYRGGPQDGEFSGAADDGRVGLPMISLENCDLSASSRKA